MTRAGDLSSINCTQCGAGLSVLGGGRVRSHVCGYCGAVLDTQDKYKILDSIGKRDHPDSPVKIGAVIPMDGVAFTVIGTIGRIQRWDGGQARWVEHQLFSPTHGYAWLSFERGNFLFTRKIRDFPATEWMRPQDAKGGVVRPHLRYRDAKYAYYEIAEGQIDFMEGEFNWTPKLGEVTRGVTLLGPDAMLTLREGRHEKEVERTTFVDRQTVLNALGIEKLYDGPPALHPLRPLDVDPNGRFKSRVFGISAAIALVMALLFGGIDGRQVLTQGSVPIGAPQVFEFDIADTRRLSEVRLFSTRSSDWVIVDIVIRGPDGALVLSGERLLANDEGARPGVTDANLRFRPAAPGAHTLTVSRDEGAEGRDMSITVEEGVGTSLWLMVLAGAFLGLGLRERSRLASYKRNRFRDSDWGD